MSAPPPGRPTSPSTCAVVLAGGRGRRLAGLTHGGNKHFIGLAGRPGLWWPLASLARCPEVGRIVVVTTPESTQAVKHLLCRLACPVPATVVVQPRPLGTLDAVMQAISQASERWLLVHYGDNVFGWSAPPPPRGEPGCLAELFTVTRSPREATALGVVRRQPHSDLLADIEEKPGGLNTPVECLTGLVRIDRIALLEAAARVAASPRGELELTDALVHLSGMGPVRVRDCAVAWADYGTPQGLRRAAAVVGSVA